MILTISQYIEALMGGDERFKTMRRLRAVSDDADLPVFVMPGHGLVDFEVFYDGVRHTLRCPLRCDADALSRLRTLVSRDNGLGGRFFTEWTLLENEAVLFDESGRVFEVDILMRPTPVGEPLANFVDKALSRGDLASVADALRGFEELAEWARNAHRSGITLRRLLVVPAGEGSDKASDRASSDGSGDNGAVQNFGDGGAVRLFLTGFSANDETERIHRMLSTAAAGEPVYGLSTTASAGEKAHDGADDRPDSKYEHPLEGGIKCVRDGGGWMYVDQRGRHITDRVWTSAAPFREGRAEVETGSGRGLIDTLGQVVIEPVYEEVTWDEYWNLAAVMSEGQWSLLDRDGILLTCDPYDWLGECSEGMVLASRGGKCGFLNAEGQPAIPLIYDDASSFSEGLAVVWQDGKSFFIDAKGIQQ